ncbi:MAG: hypothetical protein ACKO3G_12250 [Planctomycetaceae bacterium]
MGRAEDEFERPPISYSAGTPDNAVERLQRRLDAGEVALAHDGRTGYLRGVLEALGVPVSSQMLVFSKTSLQQRLITPRNPRALYFNDDVYVGWVPGGEVVEVSVADPGLGTVFYSLADEPAERPRFVRQTDDCLICHGGSQTRGVPGHVVRSVFADRGGQPIFSAGSHRVDDATPLVRRWGGWYVTGTHGSAAHLGNLTYAKRPDGEGPGDEAGLNVTDLDGRIDTGRYLAPHSDLVALSVLVHQATAHNAITKASFDARSALHREAALNRELGEPEGKRWPSTDTVLDGAAQALVDCFLFRDAPPFEAPIAGTSPFAAEFAAAGPRDPRGRSLRDLDLRTRLFRHPCSFLVYSSSFDALPEEVRSRFWRRMDGVLTATGTEGDFSHLTAADRTAVREILAATKPGAPESWRTP